MRRAVWVECVAYNVWVSILRFYMPIHQLTTDAEFAAYDAYIRAHPQGSLWQSLERKKYQEALGREVRIFTNAKCRMKNEKYDVSALVVIDRTAGGFSVWDIPRGPLMNEERKVKSEKCIEQFVQTIVEDAKKDKCLALYASPSSFFTFHSSLFTSSHRRVYAEATRIIDLTMTEDAILAQMHQKGRYNINLARKNSVNVRKGSLEDIDTFYELLKSTGSRDGFTISKKSHYARFLTDLDGSFVLIAEHDKKPIAGLIGVTWNGTGIYYYGASSYEHRQLMAPYALQWEAMLLCKAAGCTQYDLLGISAEGAPADDPWWGITDFKRKFGGTVVSYPPEQTVVLRPVIKTLLAWKRKIVG